MPTLSLRSHVTLNVQLTSHKPRSFSITRFLTHLFQLRILSTWKWCYLLLPDLASGIATSSWSSGLAKDSNKQLIVWPKETTNAYRLIVMTSHVI